MKLISLMFFVSTICLAKNPAFILYDDGTWEKVGSNAMVSSASSPSNESTGTLKIVATLKMQRGGAKPVASEDVFITTKSVKEIALEQNLNPSRDLSHMSFVNYYTFAANSTILPEYRAFANGIRNGIEKYKIDEDVTGLDGSTSLHNLAPGNYYAILRTSLGADWGCAWSVPVVIKPGMNKLNLRNENVNEDLMHEGKAAPVFLAKPSSVSPQIPPQNRGVADKPSFEESKAKIMEDYREGKLSSGEAAKKIIELKKQHNL